MTHRQRFWIPLMQLLQQTSQRTLLRIGPGVAGSLAVSGQPSHVGHPDGMPVMVPAVRPHHLLRSAHLNGAVGRYHVVVTATLPSQLTMIAVNVRHPQGTARPVGGAVHNDKSDATHRLQLRDGTARGTRDYQLDEAQYVQRDFLPIRLHTCSC